MKLLDKFSNSDEFYIIDRMMEYKLNINDFTNNKNVISNISESFDKIRKEKHGFQLFTITHGFKSKIFLLCKTLDINKAVDTYHYICFIWEKEEKIEKSMSFYMNDYSYKNDTYNEIYELSKESKLTDYMFKDFIQYCIVDSLTGLKISTKSINDIAKFENNYNHVKIISNEEYKNENNNEFELYKQVLTDKKEITNNIINQISNYSKKLKCDNLNIKYATDTITDNIITGKIIEVLNAGNRRFYKIRIHKIHNNTIIKEEFISHVDPEYNSPISITNLGTIFLATLKHRYYESNLDLTFLQKLPYNFIDKDRTFIIIQRNNNIYDMVIGSDPKVNPNNHIEMQEILNKYLTAIINKTIDFSSTSIVDKEKDLLFEYELFNQLNDSNNSNSIQQIMQTIKKMVDEYHYIVKKQKSIGEDIFITDKIQFNHEKGLVKYNNFNISIDDELVKSEIHSYFKDALVSFYREKETEEEILSKILDIIFSKIKFRIFYYSKTDMTMNIVINDNVKIVLTEKVSSNNKSKLTYINDIRFNKNEVITILKEMTCYRDQETADMFIKTIGKIGLSTYIAISTGYVFNKKLLKFRKDKGRSKYTLLLDNIEIPISSKKIISTLYSNFIDNNKLSDGQLNKLISQSIIKIEDYLKYKFLVDNSYEEFKKKSKLFLDKKVLDTNSEYIKYLNSKTKKFMDAILVTGISGAKYAISYDNTNSYVFMDPDKSDTKIGNITSYSNGKYICMIDQSNIKSNIGYDTVISKLLALRNDSIISEQIYNLKSELDNFEGETNDSD